MKNLKKALLSLLLIPSLVLTGCGKNNKTNNPPSNNQQGGETGGNTGGQTGEGSSGNTGNDGDESGGNTGNNEEGSGGVQQEEQLTLAQQEDAYRMLYGFIEDAINATNQSISITLEMNTNLNMSLKSAENFNSEEMDILNDLIEKELVDYPIGYKEEFGYNLSTGELYSVSSWLDTETETWIYDMGDYIVKDNNTHKYYSECVGFACFDREAYLVDAKHVENTLKYYLSESIITLLLTDFSNDETFEEFKQSFIDDLGEPHTFEIKKIGNDYKFIAEAKDIFYESYESEIGDLSDTLENLVYEFTFNNQGLKSLIFHNTATGSTSLTTEQVEGDINIDVIFDYNTTLTFDYEFNSSILEKDFSEFGDVTEHMYGAVNVYINDMFYRDIFVEEGTSVIEEIASHHPLSDFVELIDQYYLDEACTIPVSNELTVPSWDIEVYATINEDKIPPGKAIVLIYTGGYLYPHLVDLSKLENNVFDIKNTTPGGGISNSSLILIDGEISNNSSIVLTDGQLVLVTIEHYN